jgi:glucokinase
VGRALATGAGAIVNLLNPCRLIFGGGVIAGMLQLLEAVRRDITSWALAAPLAKVQITTAALGPHAGSVGAAAWARDMMAPAPEGAG